MSQEHDPNKVCRGMAEQIKQKEQTSKIKAMKHAYNKNVLW